MERAMRALMGNNLPPRFKFKDTYDSIQVPTAYQQHLPSQATLEAKFDELIAEEDVVAPTTQIKADMVVSSNLEVGTSNLFVDTETGNVGVGTASPSEALHIYRNDANPTYMHIVSDVANRAGISLSEDKTNKNVIIEYDGTGSGAGNYLAFYSGVSSWVGKGAGLNYVPANGRVGIGTNSPGFSLDVHGTANVGALTATSVSGPLSGNATTATALETARNINGVSFDGSGNITVNGLNYNVNNSWLRENGDNAPFKQYGNSRQMAFRTDGTTEYASGVGAYPFVWMYGGDASSNRRMFLNTSGQLWCSNYGWLHDKFMARTQVFSDTNANANFTGQKIDFNSSGSQANTTDRSHIAFHIDMDSSATGGDTNHEHRMYGIYNDVRHSGDSDLVYGIYNLARSDHTSGTTTNLRAAEFVAVASGTGTNTNVFGLNSYALKDAGSNGTTANMYGVRGEVEVDAGTCTNAYAFQSHIDRDGGTITNGYLYYGSYSGTVGTKWGVYVTGETKNYFSGNVGIGVTDPTAKLHVNGGITKTQYNPGEVIETLQGRADGSSIQVLSGTYTLPNVTVAQDIGTGHTVINGSSISYKPPPGTTRVIYEFQVYVRFKDADTLLHFAGRLGGTQVSHSRHTFRARDYEQQWVYNNMTITIGEVGSDNLAAGKLASWTTNKTLDFTARDYSGSYEGYLHRTDHWDGGGTDITVTPVIKITAIA
jgi:hypothetical protein